LAAAAPVIFWFFILRRKKREKMFFRFALTFCFAGFGAIFIFFHEENLKILLLQKGIPLFFIFFFLGISIEYFKNISVRIYGKNYFQNTDDVIDLSFASALGFTFFENIFHFYIVFSGGDPDFAGPVKMIKFFLSREFFILPIHLFTSGLFGYFYAMSIFSNAKLKNRNLNQFSFLIFYFPLRFILFFLSKNRIFKIIKILQGTLISVFFYALFYTIYQIDPMLSDIFRAFGFFRNAEMPVDERLNPLISFVFFKVGSVLLFNLMDKKNRFERQKVLRN